MDAGSLTYEQLSEWLEQKAKNRQTISYNSLAKELNLRPVNNMFTNHPLSAFFRHFDAVDNIEEQPFRTALVVQKESGRPGRGFFKSLSELRRIDIVDEEEVWQSEIDQLFSYYDPTRQLKSLTISLTHAQAKRLDALAALYNRAAEDLIEGTFSETLSYLEDQHRILSESDAAGDRGELLTHEEVFERINERLQKAS